MKKFILLNSPIFEEGSNENEEYLPPLGLGYIATYLGKEKIDVEIIDCVKERKSKEEIIKFINNSSFTYISTNIFTTNYEIVKEIVENITINCEIFIGGQVVKSIFQDILKWNVKNKMNIIIGEGELIIPQLVLGKCEQEPEKVESNKFLYRVNKNSIYSPENISDIYLNRNYLKEEVIINHYNEKEVSIITSRGCPYDCAFCGGASSLNRDLNLRIRTKESIIQEIKEIVSRYPDVRSIRILDDLFLKNKESIDTVKEIFSNFLELSWRGMVHVDVLKNSFSKIEDLKESRCKELFIGIESGSNKIRKKIKKMGTIEDILEVSSKILEVGIDLKGYFIYGFPEETEEDFKKTLELAKKIKEISLKTSGQFRTSVFQFRPYHGTQLYNEIIKIRGSIPECKTNNSLNSNKEEKGRNQFNFTSGNYSEASDAKLEEYILETQKLTKE
jgi:Fe-S oxidoreductase